MQRGLPRRRKAFRNDKLESSRLKKALLAKTPSVEFDGHVKRAGYKFLLFCKSLAAMELFIENFNNISLSHKTKELIITTISLRNKQPSIEAFESRVREHMALSDFG